MSVTVPLSTVSLVSSRVLSGCDFAGRATAPEYLIVEYSAEDESIQQESYLLTYSMEQCPS